MTPPTQPIPHAPPQVTTTVTFVTDHLILPRFVRGDMHAALATSFEASVGRLMAIVSRSMDSALAGRPPADTGTASLGDTDPTVGGPGDGDAADGSGSAGGSQKHKALPPFGMSDTEE